MGLYDRMMQGVQMAEAGKAAGQKSKLQGLLGQAVSDPNARRQALGQAAMIDAPTSLAVQEKLAGLDRDGLSRAAQMLVAAPEELRPQIYKSQVLQYGQGLGVPEEYTAFMYPMMEKLAQAGGGNNVQSRFVAEDGRVMVVMRDGSVQDTGQKADRQMWFRDHPGMAPELVGKDGMIRPVGQPQQSQPSGFGMTQVQYATEDGQAIPAGEQDELRRAMQAASRGEDFTIPVGGQPMASDGLGPRLDPVRGGYARPSEAETAAQVEYAKQRAQLAAMPQRNMMEAEGAGMKESAVQGARAQAEFEAGAPARQEAFRQLVVKTDAVGQSIDKALQQINFTTAGAVGSMLSNVPGTPAYDLKATANNIKANLAFDTLQQMRAASPTGGALGAVSERELTLLEAAVASIDQAQSPEQLKEALQTVKKHYQDWRRAAEQANREAAGRMGGSQQPAGDDDESLIGKYL